MRSRLTTLGGGSDRATRLRLSDLFLRAVVAWEYPPVAMCRVPGPAPALLVAVVSGILSLGSLAVAQPVRLTCWDGQSTGILHAFGHRVKVDWCDLDGACDGRCMGDARTPREVRCFLRIGGLTCSAHGPEPDATSLPYPGCPANFLIPLTKQLKTHRVLLSNGRVAVRCLPARQCPTTTTTSTLPPGIPDLTGDWIVSELDASDDCTPSPGVDFSMDHRLKMFQLGTDVVAFGDIINGNGTVSPDGFALDEPDCCSTRVYNFGVHLSGTIPSASGVASLTLEWTFSHLGPSAGPPLCHRTAHAVMSRVPVPCTRDEDCINMDVCSRCEAGNCALAPRFR